MSRRWLPSGRRLRRVDVVLLAPPTGTGVGPSTGAGGTIGGERAGTGAAPSAAASSGTANGAPAGTATNPIGGCVRNDCRRTGGNGYKPIGGSRRPRRCGTRRTRRGAWRTGRARRSWRRRPAQSDCGADGRHRQGAHRRLHLDERRHRILDQIRLPHSPPRRRRAHRPRHGSSSRGLHSRMETGDDDGRDGLRVHAC